MVSEWDDLPEELWESIFRCLDHCHHLEPLSLVCKRFLSISNSIRSSLSLSGDRLQSSHALFSLFRRFSHLKHVQVTGLHPDLDLLLLQLSRSDLTLESLRLCNQNHFPELAMRELGRKMRSLKILVCSNFRLLKDRDLIVIADAFPVLEELDISSSVDLVGRLGNVTDEGIGEFAIKARGLRSINLSGNHLLTNLSVSYLFLHCPLLGEVSIGDCVLIASNAISSAIRSSPCVGLSSINLSSLAVHDNTLFSISEANLKLQKLVLADCYGFTFGGISRLVQACESLHHLDLESAYFHRDEMVLALTRYFRNLISVNLSACYRLTITTFVTLVTKCPCLEDIRMEKTSLATGPALQDLTKNPRIKTLSLASNRFLCDETLSRIAVACPNLKSIDISHCWRITDEGIRELGESCCQIRELDINGCREVKILGGTGTVFSKLEILKARESGIGDEWLSIAYINCKSLRRLDLEGCLRVTEMGVKMVVSNSKWLMELSLKNCSNVLLGAEALAKLVFPNSSLRKLILPSSLALAQSHRDLFLRHGCALYQF
ncbi:uncharacterized protein [Aristolochia californica]|uniref:uncharacterized protein n=1 Tax=Aristolochia californica TaxID=171875 RepID=UPI0035DFE442